MRATEAFQQLLGAAREPYRVQVAVEVLRRVLIAAQAVVEEAEHEAQCSIYGGDGCDCPFGDALDILERALG
mgnify:CR=1 FL=1